MTEWDDISIASSDDEEVRAQSESSANEAADGDDRSREELAVLNKRGLALIHSFFSASKMVQIYKLDNNAVKRVLSEFISILKKFLEEDERACIRLAAEYLNINDVRITVDPQFFDPFQYLIDEMKKRSVESIEFSPGVTPEEIGRFLKTFYGVDEGEDAFELLEKKLMEAGVVHIGVTQLVETERVLREHTQKGRDVKLESNRVFFRALALMRDVVQAMEERRVIKIKKAKRLTQQMVDIIQTDETILLGLASIKKFDEYTFAHSVNVCILAMAMGDKLRLCKGDIARLGLSALFHDIGKVYIPESIVNNPNKLTGKDWELMKYHTLFGVKELAKVKVLKEIADAMFVSLQHHVHYNQNGYPRRKNGWRLRLFSRIVTIADYYDAMTSMRVYRRNELRPDKVIKFIFEMSGKIFDPFLSKVFVQTMGFYPVGTVVALDSGEKGIVVKPNQDIRFLHRPLIRLISGDPKNPEAGEVVDLCEKRADGRGFKRSILTSLDSSEIPAEKEESFLA